MDSLVFVIFGASGDLTRRKLIPAIFQLDRTGYLPENFAVLGVSRSSYSDEAFRDKVFFKNDLLKKNGVSEQELKHFGEKLFYEAIDTSDQEEYAKVKTRLHALDEQFDTGGNYIFYLSTPPSLYETIPAYLAHHGVEPKKWWLEPIGYRKTFWL